MGNSISGTDGTDTIHVRTASDKVLAGEGDDSIVLHARGGNATNVLSGADFAAINGEDGSDVIMIGDNNATLNLAGLGIGKISGVEGIDMVGAGNNELILDTQTLTQMGVSTLFVSGDNTDTLTLQGNWTFDGAHYVSGTDSISVSGVNVAIAMDAAGSASASANGDTITGFFGGANTITGGAGNDSITGGNMGDTLRGGGGDNTIRGGAGNDTIYVDSAGDMLYGGADHDVFILGEDTTSNQTFDKSSFSLIDGEEGTDGLMLNGSDNTLDLRGLGGEIASVEVIDISGSGDGSNTVVLDNTIFTAGSVFTIDGGVGDVCILEGPNWKYDGSEPGYQVYTNGANTLKIGDALSRTIRATDSGDTLYGGRADDVLVGGAGSDTFTLIAANGGSTVTWNDFASISGGADNDVLTLGGTDATLDLSGTGLGAISGVEAIDLGNAGNNALIIDTGTLGNMGLSSLVITGDATDSLSLQGNWSFDGTHYVFGTDSVFVSDMQVSITMDAAGAVTAGDNGDTITGFAGGANSITGGAGDDSISGGGMGDVIRGGAGSDTLVGGGGGNLFVWLDEDIVSGDVDSILDFILGSDSISLAALESESDVRAAFGGALGVSAADDNNISIAYSGLTVNVCLPGAGYDASAFTDSNTAVAEEAQIQFLLQVLAV